MDWVRLSTELPINPKVVGLLHGKEGHRALVAYVCGLAHAGRIETDGYLPRDALLYVHARNPDAERLVSAGLWVPEPGGWRIHDWRAYQLSTVEMRARSERARDAARARWHR